MKIAICVSLDFTNQIGSIIDRLTEQGYEIILPQTVKMILSDEVTFEQIMKEKKNGEISKRAIRQNTLKNYFKTIKESDAILVLNFDKNGIEGYVGGNTFLEMGFAQVLGKKIFLLNGIPNISYEDEIKAMQPIVLNGNLSKIR